MKFVILSTSVFQALAYGSSILSEFDNYGLPWYGLKTNGAAIGWLPSNGNLSEGVNSPRYTMKDINQKLGVVSSTYGMYSHLDSDDYDGYELMEEYDDVISSGAVFIPSVMPVLESGFSAIAPDVASQVAAVMRKFTDKGVVVWLRFGHEMNWYVDPVVGYEWYPGDDSVGLVGIDCYPQSSNQTFEWCYRDFYERFSASKQKPFAIGETGADAQLKEKWAKELVSQSRADYSNYISISWFEYLKQGVDFRLVEGDEETLEHTKKTFDPSHWFSL